MTHDFSNATNFDPADPRNRSEEPLATLATLADTVPFQEFDAWMDSQLGLLVEQWVRMAAPNAKNLQFRGQRFGR